MAYCNGCHKVVKSDVADPTQPATPYCDWCASIIKEGTRDDYDTPDRYPEERPQDRKEREAEKERKFKGMMCTKCCTFTEEKWPNTRVPTFLCRSCKLVWEYSNLQGFWTSNPVDLKEIAHMEQTVRALKGEPLMSLDELKERVRD
jgi:hypothetical protein